MKMNKEERYLLVNQSIGSLFYDVILEISRKTKIDIFTGTSLGLKNNKFNLYKGTRYNRKNYLTRIYTWTLFTIQLGFFLLIKRNFYKKILFVTNPPLAPFFGLLTKTSFSILIYDLYPDILKSFKKNFLFNPIIIIWKISNKVLFKKAERIFSLSESMSSELENYFYSKNNFEEKVHIIPPWSTTKNFKKNESSFFSEKYKKQDLFLRIIYSGNIGVTHPLENIIYSIPNIKNKAKCIISGNGAKLDKLKRISKGLNLSSDDLKFLDFIDSEEEFFYFLSNADFSVVALDEKLGGSSLPSKIFNSLELGVPIIGITSENSSVANLIKKYKCGINIPPDAKFKLKLDFFIEKVCNEKKFLQNLKINAKKASIQFTVKNAEKLTNLFLAC